MIDDNSPPPGNESAPAPATDDGKLGRKISDKATFQSAGGTGASPGSRGPASRGKNKGGRPPKNIAGLSKETIDEVVDDPEVEAARAEFEECIVSLLVTATDNLADENFEILKKKHPEAVARGLAEKAKLTDKEKKYLGPLAIRLWRKYVGDKYLFSDEAIAGMYALQYMTRNFTVLGEVRKIKKEIDGANKQPGLQSEKHPDSGSQKNGKDHAGLSGNRLTPSAVGSDL